MADDRYGKSNLKQPGEGKWLEQGVILALLLAVGIALSSNGADADLWGHVTYGRDLLRDGLPSTNTYSYTAAGHRWINHENLAEILLAIGADSIGPIGLLAAKMMLGVFVFGLIMRHARERHVSLLALSLVTLIAAFNLTRCWTLRPQLLSFTCFAAMLGILSFAFHQWEGRWRLSRRDKLADVERENRLEYSAARLKWLWLLAPLFCVWANSHGGFAAGLFFLAAYLGCRSLEAIVCLRRDSVGLLKRFALMFAAAIAGTFINPYGYKLHFWMMGALGNPRPEITEWHPPELFTIEFAPLVIMLGLWIAALLLTRRSRDFTHLVLMVIAAWQMFEHQRHVAFFAIAFGYWMPTHVDSMLQNMRLATDNHAFGVGMSRSVRWMTGLGICLVLVIVGGRLSRRLDDLPVHRSEYPVSAFEYIAERQLHGKAIVAFNWAQYAIGAFGTLDAEKNPGILVDFDGRFRTCYPQSVIDRHFDLILGDLGPAGRFRSPQSPPFNDSAVLQFAEPDLALIDRMQPHSELAMRKNADRWTLLYQDELAQLWGRAAKYDDPASPDYIPVGERRITNDVQEGSVTWPGYPARRALAADASDPDESTEAARRWDALMRHLRG